MDLAEIVNRMPAHLRAGIAERLSSVPERARSCELPPPGEMRQVASHRCDSRRLDGADCTGEHRVLVDHRGYRSVQDCQTCWADRQLERAVGDLHPDPATAAETARNLARSTLLVPLQRPSDEALHASVRTFIADARGRALVLSGPPQCGKTFLALHVLRAVVMMAAKGQPRRMANPLVRYMPEAVYVDAWQSSHSSNAAVEAWGRRTVESARTATVLLLDDLGEQGALSDKALDELQRLIKWRTDAQAGLLITTNLTPQRLQDVRGARVWARIQAMSEGMRHELPAKRWERSRAA